MTVMDAWRIVTKELLQFVFIEWFGWRYPRNHHTVLELPAYEWLKPAVANQKPLVKLEDKPMTLVPRTESSAIVVNNRAKIFIAPALTFDGVLVEVPYGAVVDIFETQNRWFKVSYQEIVGWMLREDLVEELKVPQFKLGVFYTANSEETISVRRELEDEFFGGLAELPLTAEEYVTYRLKRSGVKIPWGNERPRLSGTWQNLLKGRRGAHLGITPKTGSLMEIIEEATLGHLAYIEAVYPDQSIMISEFGYPELGQYSERTLPKAEWIEWRPVFIEIT